MSEKSPSVPIVFILATLVCLSSPGSCLTSMRMEAGTLEPAVDRAPDRRTHLCYTDAADPLNPSKVSAAIGVADWRRLGLPHRGRQKWTGRPRCVAARTSFWSAGRSRGPWRAP